MNTIPAPKITHPNKAMLKRKPVVRTWVRVSATAIVVLSLGLGYFFSQWSAPPVAEMVKIAETTITPLPEEEIVVEPEVVPEPIVTPIKKVEEPVQKEQITVTPAEQIEVAVMPRIEPVTIDIEYATIEIKPTLSSIPEPTEVEIDETIELSYNRLENVAFLAEYGQEAVASVKRIPASIVEIAKSYTRPFRKK